MPRPRQRRGADAKKEEKKMKREKEEAEARAADAAAKRQRHKKSEMPWNQLSATADSRPDAPVDPDALPEPDPDTKAYFREIAEKIQELEGLGQGRGSYTKVGEDGEEEEQEEDDRPLLLRSALESLSGHEIPLAGDGETSVILERLLYAMDDFARRVLADRFIGNYEKLVKHRSASHVLQTLFTLAGETIDRETRGTIASPPVSSSESASLPTMTSLVLSALTELLPHLPTLLYDPFGSHTLRILLLLFAGTAPTAEGQSGAERSKRSLNFRKGQGKMKSFLLDDDHSGGKGKEKEVVTKRNVPTEFNDALTSMWQSLNAVDDGGPLGEGIRRAAMDDVAGPAVRVMIEMEAVAPGGWMKGGWADRVLCGLVEEVKNPDSKTEERSELREEYLAGLLRHPASSPTFETLLTRSSKPIFSAIWEAFFVSKLHRLAGNAVANFVVAVGISRLDEEELKQTIEEIGKIATERRGEWIDNSRTGVFRSLLEQAAKLSVCEKEISEIIVDTFGLNDPENRKLVAPCVLSLNRLDYWKKLPSHVTAQPSTQGSILLQTWLKLHAPHQQVVLDSINSLGFDGILPLTRDATSSRVLDSLLSSPTTPPREIRRFLLSLLGHYHTLADDRIGSRVVERCWATADVYLKDKIAASLTEQGNFLQSSQFGHFFARKVELPLFMRRREEWKAKMARQMAEQKGLRMPGAPAGGAQGGASTEEKKRRERPADEVDEIFGGKAARPAKKGRTEDSSEVQKTAVKKVEGLDDVYAALKASAA